MNGEWTAESVMKMFGWRYKKRAEAVAKVHNAALAAVWNHSNTIAVLADDQVASFNATCDDLREQLASATARELHSYDVAKKCRDELAVLTRENDGRDEAEAEYAQKMVAEIQARDKQLATEQKKVQVAGQGLKIAADTIQQLRDLRDQLAAERKKNAS